jgi:hypothetical protein
MERGDSLIAASADPFTLNELPTSGQTPSRLAKLGPLRKLRIAAGGFLAGRRHPRGHEGAVGAAAPRPGGRARRTVSVTPRGVRFPARSGGAGYGRPRPDRNASEG